MCLPGIVAVYQQTQLSMMAPGGNHPELFFIGFGAVRFLNDGSLQKVYGFQRAFQVLAGELPSQEQEFIGLLGQQGLLQEVESL